MRTTVFKEPKPTLEGSKLLLQAAPKGLSFDQVEALFSLKIREGTVHYLYSITSEDSVLSKAKR